MKTITNLLLLAILLVPGIVFSQGTETRKLSSFAKLQVSGSFDTFVEQGNEESVRIEAEGIDPKKIISEVKGDVLKVYLEKGSYQNIRAKVYITFKALEGIDQSGSGDLSCKSALSAANFRLSSSGSGDILISKGIKAGKLSISFSGSGDGQFASFEASDLNLSLSGSGDVHVSSGYVKKQSIQMSGSGNVEMLGLKSDICSLSISGSNNVEVIAEQSLEISISGSGDIKYKGNAQIIKCAVSGSGRIRKV